MVDNTSLIKESTNLFDTLYSRFVLRDFCAKIVPGLMLLSSVIMSLTSPLITFTYIERLTAGAWITTFGVAWVVGFAIQAFGKYTTLTKMSLEDIDKDYLIKEIQFRRRASMDEKQQYERYTIIKESCGNSSMALLLSLFLLGIDVVFDYFSGVLCIQQIKTSLSILAPTVLLWLSSIYLLWRMHHDHREYQCIHLQEVLKSPKRR